MHLQRDPGEVLSGDGDVGVGPQPGRRLRRGIPAGWRRHRHRTARHHPREQVVATGRHVLERETTGLVDRGEQPIDRGDRFIDVRQPDLRVAQVQSRRRNERALDPRNRREDQLQIDPVFSSPAATGMVVEALGDEPGKQTGAYPLTGSPWAGSCPCRSARRVCICCLAPADGAVVIIRRTNRSPTEFVARRSAVPCCAGSRTRRSPLAAANACDRCHGRRSCPRRTAAAAARRPHHEPHRPDGCAHRGIAPLVEHHAGDDTATRQLHGDLARFAVRQRHRRALQLTRRCP